jgi:acetyl esterase
MQSVFSVVHPNGDMDVDGAGPTLDPQVARVVERVHEGGFPGWHALSVERARRVEEEIFSPGAAPELADVRDRSIPGPADDLGVRIYRPGADGPIPTLVFYHGGGWCLGTLDSADDVCRLLADRVGCVVVSVDYRLAPEHRFPAAVKDAFAAAEWAAENAGALGGDPALGVAGTSAGGSLAAATALLARDRDGPAIAHQLLCYPLVDYAHGTRTADGARRTAGVHVVDGAGPAENAVDPDGSGDAEEGHAGETLLTRADVAWFWEQYLPDSSAGADPLASPLRASDFGELPSATVLTCGFDPLCAEGAAYADRLADAAVPVVHEHYPRLAHGFLSLTDTVDAADRAMDDAAVAVRSTLD